MDKLHLFETILFFHLSYEKHNVAQSSLTNIRSTHYINEYNDDIGPENKRRRSIYESISRINKQFPLRSI